MELLNELVGGWWDQRWQIQMMKLGYEYAIEVRTTTVLNDKHFVRTFQNVGN
jgi:hypothetical protein